MRPYTPISSIVCAIRTSFTQWLHRQHLGRPYHVIDAHIVALVQLMNSHHGICTVASCQGHHLGARPPYVYFKATTPFVQALEAALRDARSKQELNFYWVLKGLLDENCQLTFLLSSSELDERVYSIFWAPYMFWRGRKAIDQDLHTIGRLISEGQPAMTARPL
ncbi:hypothetical protein [Vogesella oryzae]|uniref:hypothetical protein n=1 Tax=Vogesella oryzae TaxID=1735285 RepID=UPI001582C6D2|nr:hypothetical protein [Vogesella oryzae]